MGVSGGGVRGGGGRPGKRGKGFPAGDLNVPAGGCGPAKKEGRPGWAWDPPPRSALRRRPAQARQRARLPESRPPTPQTHSRAGPPRGRSSPEGSEPSLY